MFGKMKRPGEWIRARRETLNLTQQDLSERSGVGIATVRRLEKDPRKANRATLKAVARALKIEEITDAFVKWSLDQISFKEFLMQLNGSPAKGVNEQMRRFFNEHGLKLPERSFLKQPGVPDEIDFYPSDPENGLPVLGEVTAGGLVESMVFDPGDEPERVPLHYPGKTRVYALRIRGESMSPEYRPGEILIVEDATAEQLEDGEDAVIQCNGGRDGQSTFKRCIFAGDGRVKLVPLNRSFPTVECDLDHVVRVGKVLGVYRPKGIKPREQS